MMDTKEHSGLDTVQRIIAGQDKVPHHDHLNIRFTKAASGYLEAECTLDPNKHGNGFNDFAHGGSLVSFADAVGGFAFVTTIQPDQNKPVMENLTLQFLRPVKIDGPPLKAIGNVIETTRSGGMVSVRITQGEKTAAYATGKLRIV